MNRQTMLFIAFLLVLQHVSAVTLNDFTPRLSDLTGTCKTIYTSDIDGCAGEDFQTGECSSSCVSALRSLGAAVRTSCQGQTSDGIIGAFINDQGAQNLCKNADSVSQATSAQKSSASISIGSSTMVASDTAVSTTGLMVDTSGMRTSFVTALSTATIQPLPGSSSSSSDVAVFTGITSTITGTSLAFATSTPSSVLVATQTSLSSTQSAKHTQTEDSSGGTPFDTSAAHRGSASYLTLLSGVLAFLCLY